MRQILVGKALVLADGRVTNEEGAWLASLARSLELAPDLCDRILGEDATLDARAGEHLETVYKDIVDNKAVARRMSLDAFVAELALLRVENPREPDAPPEDTSDTVKIMTVHSAKGLEYPIVFCPFLWDGHPGGGRAGTPGKEYHDDAGATVLDFRPETRSDENITARMNEMTYVPLLLIWIWLSPVPAIFTVAAS